MDIKLDDQLFSDSGLAKANIRPPFPYYGGKRKVAPFVWQLLGNPSNYVEPFFGGGSTLLLRPANHFETDIARIETINELSPYVANFWRATKADPEQVAYFADWPVNEADLHARHLWLIRQEEFRETTMTDPDYFDAKIAGWWVWGICQWIGSGWCELRLDGKPGDKRHHLSTAGQGVQTVSQQLPHLAGGGRGIASPSIRLPYLHSLGSGYRQNLEEKVSRKLPHLGDAGRGIASPSILKDQLETVADELPFLADPSQSWIMAQRRKNGLYAYFDRLAERLRNVRVVCGDFERVLGPSVTGIAERPGANAVFFDPPYPNQEELYGVKEKCFYRAAAWCEANGDNPKLKIILCGYEGDWQPPDGWATYEWKAGKGYANQDNGNRELERLWASPACNLPVVQAVKSLPNHEQLEMF